MWTHAFRLATGLGVAGVEVIAVLERPEGVERTLRVGSGTVAERIVVPRSGPFGLLEWEADRRTELDVAWRADLRPAPPEVLPADRPLRFRREERGLVIAGPGSTVAVYAFSRAPEEMTSVREADGIRVAARLRLEPGKPVRLALVGGERAPGGGGGREVSGPRTPALGRALRAVDRTRALVAARRGEAERLRKDRLSLDASDGKAGERLERAKAGLDAHRAEWPGGGRSFLAGYAALDAGPWRAEHRTADAVVAGAAALALGDSGAARDVLLFLGRLQDASGRVPGVRTAAGAVRADPDATGGYLRLVVRYLAWSGDLATVRGEWPRIRAAAAALGRSEAGKGGGVAGLAAAAEAVGDGATAATLRSPGDRDHADVRAPRPAYDPGVPPHLADPGAADTRDAASPASVVAWAEVVLSVAEGLLGAEPDAARGRLVLRPRPPEAWDWLMVRSLTMGGASVTVEHEREAATHRFRVTQERGSAPVQLILAPELRGRYRGARVDGGAADLDAVAEGDRVRVPVQLVLDHPRTLEVDLEP